MPRSFRNAQLFRNPEMSKPPSHPGTACRCLSACARAGGILCMLISRSIQSTMTWPAKLPTQPATLGRTLFSPERNGTPAIKRHFVVSHVASAASATHHHVFVPRKQDPWIHWVKPRSCFFLFFTLGRSCVAACHSACGEDLTLWGMGKENDGRQGQVAAHVQRSCGQAIQQCFLPETSEQRTRVSVWRVAGPH